MPAPAAAVLGIHLSTPDPMITKEQLESALVHECDITVHLFGKLTPEGYDYRPSPGVRSTTELLRYLAMCGIGGIRWFESGSLDVWKEHQARVADMGPGAFPDEMDRQKREIREFFAATSEETLGTKEAKLPTGARMPLGAAIMNGPLKWLAAYKLQLFSHAKANGAEIGTANAWAGIDWRR